MANFTFIGQPDIAAAGEQKEVVANEAMEALAKGAGASSKSVAAGGTVTLSEAESLYLFQDLTGAPGSTVTVVKAVGITTATFFRNSTTGGQIINVKMDGGTSFPVPVGATVLLLSATIAVFLNGGDDRAAIRSEAATYTAVLTDATILMDATGGARTVNLPTAASSRGVRYNIKKTDASGNAVTVDGNASETIDGATTFALTVQYQSVTVQSDGTGWQIL